MFRWLIILLLLVSFSPMQVMGESNSEKRALINRAARGDKNACYTVGRNLFLGFWECGSKRKLGFEYLLRAAELGHVQAMHDVGDYYRRGKGHLPVSKSQGREWLEKAAKAGHAEAAQKLQEHYGITLQKKKKKRKKKKETAQDPTVDKISKVAEAIQQIRIQRLIFEDTPLEDLLEFLRAETRKQGFYGINYIIEAGPSDSPKHRYVSFLSISIKLEDVSVKELLDVVKGQAGIDYKVAPQGIIITYDGPVPETTSADKDPEQEEPAPEPVPAPLPLWAQNPYPSPAR